MKRASAIFRKPSPTPKRAAIVLTHGHNDHVNAAVPLRDAVDAPILLHPDDRMLWDVVWPDATPDRDLVPGATVTGDPSGIRPSVPDHLALK